MTNREWLLNKMQNMSDTELAIELESFSNFCPYLKSGEHCQDDCASCVAEWLESEHKEKITISETERIILENIDKDYCYIARDKDGDLWIYASKPQWNKESKLWCNVHDTLIAREFYPFNHLFKFIKWENEQAYNIEELLKGE